MGWNNCTQQEAQDAYDYAKGNYQRAAEGYRQNKQKLDRYEYDYNCTKNDYSEANTERLNFEKRIEGIDEIIKLLAVEGPVNEMINSSNSCALKLENSWEQYIQCSDVGVPTIYQAFKLPSVTENPTSNLALTQLKNEKLRLEQAIAELDKKMQQMEAELDAMIKSMNAIQADQDALSRTMKQSSYEMNHFKKFL